MPDAQRRQMPTQHSGTRQPGGILVTSSSNYGSKESIPLAFSVRQATASQPASPVSSPRTTSPASNRNYESSEWTFVALERPIEKSRYLVTLLYLPHMRMYTWSVDPKNPRARGKCFVTSLKIHDTQASHTTLKLSLRVLFDVMRSWMSVIRSSARHKETQRWRYSAGSDEIDRVTAQLKLPRTTQQQRRQWLAHQIIPDDVSLSVTNSPLSTPNSSANSVDGLDMAGLQLRSSKSLPVSPQLRPSEFGSSNVSLAVPPIQQDTHISRPVSHRSSTASVPSVTVTEPETQVGLVSDLDLNAKGHDKMDKTNATFAISEASRSIPTNPVSRDDTNRHNDLITALDVKLKETIKAGEVEAEVSGRPTVAHSRFTKQRFTGFQRSQHK